MKNKFWVKMSALTLSAAVVAGCGAFTGCNNSDGGNKIPEMQKIEDLSDDRYVNLYGRNYYNENLEGTTFINSASGFEFKFRGTAVYADICVIGSRDSMWSVFVDGETDSNARVLTFKETRGMFAKKTLVEGLPSDEHTLKILKRTMSSADYAVIKNLSSDGAFLGAPEKPKLHIAFYGDSITCGSGVLREYKPADSKIHTAETQNALQSYAAYCASELGASFGVFGRGGITLKFRNPATEPFSVINNYKSMAVDLSVENGECPEYDFSDMPDAVVIYLGTNDYLRRLSSNTGYSIAGMEAAYIEFVDKLVGAYYGFDIPVVLCSGLMVRSSGLAGSVKSAAQKLKAKYPYIEAIDFEAGVTEATGGHPVVEDSVKAGSQLAKTLKTLLENSGRILE